MNMNISQEEQKLYDCECLSPRSSGLYHDWILRYIEKDEALRSLYEYEPTVEGVRQFIKDSRFTEQRRRLVSQAIMQQYSGMELPANVRRNIEQLAHPNTFTLTTGHQLVLMGGPLFVAYKILSVIRMAEQLNALMPNHHFVPVFWMASEDHDWEEVNHFYFRGKRYEWQPDYAGAVGRYVLPDMQHFVEQLPEEIRSWAAAYRSGDTWAMATRRLLHQLFGELGLVIIDGDDPCLKALWKDVIWQELTQMPTQAAVALQSEKISQMNGIVQAHARNINLFYITDGERLRVERTAEGRWQTVGGELQWSLTELREAVEQQPERWSPNVILRPVYQQAILPNAVYIGGPGELSYWLQLRRAFAYWRRFDEHIQMPVLGLRHSLFVLTPADLRKIEKNALQPIHFFQPIEQLLKAWLQTHVHETAVFDQAKVKTKEAYALLLPEVGAVDASLDKKVKAYETQALKQIDELEKRFYKAVKQREETAIRQIRSVHESLFPAGVPQERHESLFTFFVYHPERNYWQQLLSLLKPFETEVLLLKENT